MPSANAIFSSLLHIVISSLLWPNQLSEAQQICASCASTLLRSQWQVKEHQNAPPKLSPWGHRLASNSTAPSFPFWRWLRNWYQKCAAGELFIGVHGNAACGRWRVHNCARLFGRLLRGLPSAKPDSNVFRRIIHSLFIICSFKGATLPISQWKWQCSRATTNVEIST